MSKKKLDPKAVEEFLILNPDFLSQNSKILNSIEIVHETGGAVSLIQKQVELLRKNYESTSGNLLQLIDIAKANEEIFDKTKQLLLSLIICRNLSDIISDFVTKVKLGRGKYLEKFNMRQHQVIARHRASRHSFSG